MLTDVLHSSEPTSIPGSRVPILFAENSLDRLGELCKNLNAKRVLLVTDPGIEAAGYPERAIRSLYQSQLVVKLFDEVDENPTTTTVNKALRAAKPFNPDLIVIGFPGTPCHWFENPRGKDGHWTPHEIWPSACNESPLYADLFGTGKRVLVMGWQPKGKDNEGQMAWFAPGGRAGLQ